MQNKPFFPPRKDLDSCCPQVYEYLVEIRGMWNLNYQMLEDAYTRVYQGAGEPAWFLDRVWLRYFSPEINQNVGKLLDTFPENL